MDACSSARNAHAREYIEAQMIKSTELALFDELCDALDSADAELASRPQSDPRVFYWPELNSWFGANEYGSHVAITEDEAKRRLSIGR